MSSTRVPETLNSQRQVEKKQKDPSTRADDSFGMFGPPVQLIWILQTIWKKKNPISHPLIRLLNTYVNMHIWTARGCGRKKDWHIHTPFQDSQTHIMYSRYAFLGCILTAQNGQPIAQVVLFLSETGMLGGILQLCSPKAIHIYLYIYTNKALHPNSKLKEKMPQSKVT